MKKSLLIENISVIVAAAISFGTLPSAQGDNCGGNSAPVPDVVVFENEPFARICLYRFEDTSVVQTVDFFTTDGSTHSANHVGKAGVHYMARRGTVTFAVGQHVASVDVPLIDNGLVDGFKDFTFMLTNPAPGLLLAWPPDLTWIRIEDNELPSSIDPLFVPDVPSSDHYYSWPLEMPDGRVLTGNGPGRPTMLQSNGRVDRSFATTLATSFSNAWLYPLQVLGDGRILASAGVYLGTNAPTERMVRLLPSGALDIVFTNLSRTEFVTAQPDGKMLVGSLRRLNSDGSTDGGFMPSTVNGSVALQSDGKILVVRSTSLARLNADGSQDNTFSPPPFTNGISYLIPRRNGKVIVVERASYIRLTSFIQLNGDGSIDASFHLDADPNWSAALPQLPQLEEPDGRLFGVVIEDDGSGAVVRWNGDGSVDPNFALFRQPPLGCPWFPPQLAFGGPGRIFMSGMFADVDGFPRRGLARLLINPPERDFRVLTPAEFYRSSGVARIQVVRTGPTTTAASISFATGDDTANAGNDYVSRSGTLNFAPLEVSKEILVSLLAGSGADARLFLNLELSNPSAGYTNIASTPIVLLPDLRIATDSLRPRADGSIALTLHGTVPGRDYTLETSTDLKNWEWIANTQATGSTVSFDNLPRRPSPQFFRAVRY